MLHIYQVEEQELAICSGRRSINKNTTFKQKEECIARRKRKKRKRRKPPSIKVKARLGGPRRSGTTQQPIQWEWIEGGACDELTTSSSEASTREASCQAHPAVLHVLQVEEQELAICSGRRSISKNTTLKSKRECIARKERR